MIVEPKLKKMYMFCFLKFRVKAMYVSYYCILQNAWYAVFYCLTCCSFIYKSWDIFGK